MARQMTGPARADAASLKAVAAVVAAALGLDPARGAALDRDSALFGALPELDSMAVATVLTALEDHFGILIDDADVTAEMFDTLGTLAAFVEGCRRR